jgi:hypothetical protein
VSGAGADWAGRWDDLTAVLAPWAVAA